jgi:hypothetical protein
VSETSILISGHALYEPTTVITDLIISLSCAVFAFYLKRTQGDKEQKKYWLLFFIFIGLSTLIGAIAHGFKPYFQPKVYYVVWMLMNLTSIPSSFYLLKATIGISNYSPEKKKELGRYALYAMIVLALLTVVINQFVLIKINAGIVILLTIIRHVQTQKQGWAGSGLIWGGFAFSLSSLIVHTAKLSYSEWFNFKDISHVIMNISLAIIWIGATREIEFLDNPVTYSPVSASNKS